jgi:hypothetical protein
MEKANKTMASQRDQIMTLERTILSNERTIEEKHSEVSHLNDSIQRLNGTHLFTDMNQPNQPNNTHLIAVNR